MAGTYANCQVVSDSLGFHRNSVFSGLLRQANIFNGQKPTLLGNKQLGKPPLGREKSRAETPE